MYNLDLENVKKLIEINNWLNQIEVKGIQNLNFLTSSIITLQQVLKKLEEEEKGLVVDNTKEEK